MILIKVLFLLKNEFKSAKMMKSYIFFLCMKCIIASNLLLSMPHIYIFGDSHARWGFSDMGQLEYLYSYNDVVKLPIHINSAGSKTIQLVIQQGLNVVDYGVKENDIIMFVFGEVDVRYNIGKERDLQHKDVNEIIDLLVRNYIRAMIDNRKNYSNLDCVVMEVMPPARHNTYYGTIQDRVSITQALNKRLRQECELHNILFLPLHDIYANPDGSLNPDMAEGTVHINMHHNFHIKNRLVELLLDSKII